MVPLISDLHADLVIYLDATRDDCYARRVHRDYCYPELPSYFDDYVWPRVEAVKLTAVARGGVVVPSGDLAAVCDSVLNHARVKLAKKM